MLRSLPGTLGTLMRPGSPVFDTADYYSRPAGNSWGQPGKLLFLEALNAIIAFT
jgi:hypothetical protein